MQQAYQVYIAILAFSALVSAGMLARLWQLRKSPGANGLMAAVFFVAVWSLAYLMEISSLTPQVKLAWAKIQFIGIPFAPIGLFIFALHYSGRERWLTRPRTALLLLPGILTVALAFSNEMHGQIWRGIALTDGQPFGPLNLTHGAAFYISSLHFYAAKKDLELTQTIDPNLPDQVLGDLYWLRQIAVNLVSNAIKFTAQGQVRLAFKCSGDNAWAIEVSDDGIGISQAEQSQIFEPFEQSDDPQARKQYGSGLGLSIVRELTRLMEGRIELESEPGKGSIFRVILPLKLPEKNSMPN